MNILLIDNYDSFTYNLFHFLDELNEGGVEVVRNDELDLDKVQNFGRVVLSPGPGLPKDAGKLMGFLKHYATDIPILGVCLGQQAIAEHFGMKLKNLSEVVHGQSRKINVLEANSGLFKNLPSEMMVGRYHSWVIEPETISEHFQVTSTDEDGNIMSIQHKNLPIYAVQFHPESVLTPQGKEIVKNWLDAKA
ncbi:aminodeoxychorismate/anthranilate synthase component II [Vicingaceae bacterium]|nr:aminodeoxychorismate/anthranilate synthase component II [bacterium]MDC1451431.1 aminodeoxychorismate/anthranilate synthase component II [Vicingaceae bacterium]